MTDIVARAEAALRAYEESSHDLSPDMVRELADEVKALREECEDHAMDAEAVYERESAKRRKAESERDQLRAAVDRVREWASYARGFDLTPDGGWWEAVGHCVADVERALDGPGDDNNGGETE